MTVLETKMAWLLELVEYRANARAWNDRDEVERADRETVVLMAEIAVLAGEHAPCEGERL